MVKSLLGDEARFKSTEDRLFNTNPPSEIGLIIGKLNSTLDRGFIFDLIPTPPNDNNLPPSSLSSSTIKSTNKKNLPSPSLLLDADWISEHARQVSQMLLGGMNVIGIYMWAPETSFTPSTSALAQVIKSVIVTVSEGILVHFCYSPRKLVIRNCVTGPASFRVCDFKLGKVLSSLRHFKCLYNFDMQVPIWRGGRFKDVIREGIARHEKELSNAKALIDGNLVVDTVSDGSHDVELLLPGMGNYGGEAKGEVIGIVVFKGFVCSYAYLNPKESVEQAVSDIKRDIVMSLRSRLNILCDEVEEDVVKEENGEGLIEKSVTDLELKLLKKPTSLSFPRRVLVPWIGDVYVCDYLQSGDTFEVVRDHCKELMSLQAPADSSQILEPEKEAVSLAVRSFWDAVSPKNLASLSDSNSNLKRDKVSMQKEGSKTSVKSTTFNPVIAIAVLILAILIGVLMYRFR